MSDRTLEMVARTLFESWQAGDAPGLATDLHPGLDEAGAYGVQAAYVQLRHGPDGIAGFKVGATAEPVREALSIRDPLTGVLGSSGRRETGSTIESAEFGRLVIETEIGFRAATRIAEPVRGVEALKERIFTIFPVFELAELGFYGTHPVSGVNLIAANSASGGYLPGADQKCDEFDPDAQEVTLYFDDEPLYRASAREPFGGQWRSLEWLVNRVVALGYVIQPGQIFLTGSLGRPQAVKPGRYRADYGALGSLDFRFAE